jgi:NRAMP (natural resistance-associated macrophage protein)-like metal ion transporter
MVARATAHYAGGAQRVGPTTTRSTQRARRVFKILGPGLVTGASDDDPSGIATYAAAGAALGFAPLWTALATFPLMAAVQLICAKIGLVSGRGLAGVLRRHYPRPMLYLVVPGLVMANTINAGTDLGAIAAAVNLLVPIPAATLVVPVALALVALQLWGSYRLIATTFKWLTVALFAYVGAAFLARPSLGEVLRGTFLPIIRFDRTYLTTLVAILGTTISPYLFFWQASQEVEEEVVNLGRRRLWQRRGATAAEVGDAAWDTGIGMLFSNAVMYFIILATAATLFKAGKTDIQSAREAAEALRPLAGPAATVLFALGLVGSGLLAVPILTGSAAYAVAEACGWKSGLDRKPGRARPFYGVVIGATMIGLAINFLGINPIAALVWTAVINGFVAPPLLVVIMRVANNRAVMGPRVNGAGLNVLGWATTALMWAAAIGLVLAWSRAS